MVTRQKVLHIGSLADAIGAGCKDLHEPGPVAVEIILQDVAVITGTYHECAESEVDIKDSHDIITDTRALFAHAEKLVWNGESFITETGSGDMRCTLKWEIRKPE